MKILIIQQKMIGDVLTSSILFEALRTQYKGATLHYLINQNTVAVVENNPYIDEFIIVSPKDLKNLYKLVRFAKVIRNAQYDIIIDVYSKLSSHIITAFSKAKIKISYYKKHSLWIYDHNIKRGQHSSVQNGLEIHNRLKLLKPLGIEETIPVPKIYLNDKEIASAQQYLINQGVDLNSPLFMISVLGSDPSKTYPLMYMAKIVDYIVAETHGQILFNYNPNQKSDAKLVYDFCEEQTKKHIYFDVFGKSLREFLAITKHCTALMGNEGGAINMAKALDIPTFSIFSPWINKEGWDLFKDQKKHDSIHLIDVKPNLFQTNTLKTYKSKSKFLYNLFSPQYVKKALSQYLEQFK